MNKDRLIGAGRQMLGCAKQAISKRVGDSRLQVDGRAEQVSGKAQNDAGGVKDTLKS